MFTSIQIYNTPGIYTWDKPKRPDGGDFTDDAFIIVEVCGGGAGGASGTAIIATESNNGLGSVGGAGGGSGAIATRSFAFSELDDHISVKVGQGGTGGQASVFDSNVLEHLAGNDGGAGDDSFFGPFGNEHTLVVGAGSPSTITLNSFPYSSSSSGTENGGSVAYINGDRHNGGRVNIHGTYGGGTGAGWIDENGMPSIASPGASDGGGNGGDVGQNGTDAALYGGGGGGGGAVAVPKGSVSTAGSGGDGQSGYVKIIITRNSFG